MDTELKQLVERLELATARLEKLGVTSGAGPEKMAAGRFTGKRRGYLNRLKNWERGVGWRKK